MAVSEDIREDVNRIGAASTSEGVPGDNTNAIAIAELQTLLTMAGGSATFDDIYNSLVSDIGNEVQKATVNYDHHSSMATQLEAYRESNSGVSLDEEMVNMIKFQHAYNAAAKLITTTDELLNTVLNMT